MESQDRCESYTINILLPEEFNYFQQYQNRSNDNDSVMDSSDNNSSSLSSYNDPGDVDDDLEEDAVGAKDIRHDMLNDIKALIIDTAYLKHYSKSGSKPYVYSENLKKFFACRLFSIDETDTTVLRVQHKKQEHELGDDFGANISSKEYYIKGDMYYKHVFCKIQPDTVASEIKLVDGDELVLLNSKFMPHLSHQEVVDKIKHLPVDLEERISLVIRRSGEVQPWISISARLVSSMGEDRIAKDIQTSFAAHPPRTPVDSLLELENKEGVCMLIENNKIGTWTLQNNSSDNKAVVSLDCTITIGKDGVLAFVATIKKNENGYIFVDSNKSVCLNREKGCEFIYMAIGEKKMFKHQESGMYLGYQGSNVCLKPYEYKFVRNPPMNYDGLR
ncbi:hypothetical protein CHS0354_006488 [Potamilus streckersoni]|uniref:PDZ domain-containing protein n=1 Tax=Potamilus streckersoni TaxID=2493646 RepID=A0AAE0VGJ1_9BIVA|nr:hypothetical protein CHS0354_006488 [Potamilus streckersoni]